MGDAESLRRVHERLDNLFSEVSEVKSGVAAVNAWKEAVDLASIERRVGEMERNRARDLGLFAGLSAAVSFVVAVLPRVFDFSSWLSR